MSTLWTPDGERPVRRDPPAGTGSGQPASAGGGPPAGDPGDGPISPEDEAAMAELQEQLAHTPVELVIANHAFGMFELAALHLSLQPPQLPQARLAIDALGALIEGLAGRLGEYERQLIEGLANLRMAYVQIRAASEGAPGVPGVPGSQGEPAPAGAATPWPPTGENA